MNLSEKYRPHRIAEFVGLTKPKKVLQRLASAPFGSSWLFVGRSGTGKTAMAHALATEIKAQVHLLPAHECTRENVAHVWNLCQKAPWPGFKRHLILVDQADALSKLLQTDLRSKLEPFTLRGVIWVFTATESDHLDEGFRSRCHILEFSSYGTAKETALMLERIWVAESSPGSPTPNFARITKESTGNMWTALKQLETKLQQG